MVKLDIEEIAVQKSQSTEWNGTCRSNSISDTELQSEIPSLAGSHPKSTSNLFPS